MPRGPAWHSIVGVVLAAAVAMAFVLGVAAAAGRDTTHRCEYGVSSIGPVEIESGRIVGSPRPRTETCLR